MMPTGWSAATRKVSVASSSVKTHARSNHCAPSTVSQPLALCLLTCLPAAVFTVMCYNVLCDKYATRQLYGYCPSWALNWEYRKKGIMEEITNCDADIISLQVI